MRCCDARACASAALARARAAVAGAVKPARSLRPDRREVSPRDCASRSATRSCSRQVRRLLVCCATSAATLTRASCHSACAPASRSSAAVLVARFAPKRSISQLACSPACAVVAMPASCSLKPRLALACASSDGSSAARLATCVARACAMRDWACATPGLTAWAASINSTSSGSPSCVHHRVRSPSEPWCGKGACHATGGVVGTWAGGAVMAQAPRARGRQVAQKNRVLLKVMRWIPCANSVKYCGARAVVRPAAWRSRPAPCSGRNRSAGPPIRPQPQTPPAAVQ